MKDRKWDDHRRFERNLDKWNRFKKFLYNKENKTCCGRTALTWFSIIAYFAAFAGMMFGIFIAFLLIVTNKLSQSKTPAINKNTLLENHAPGLSFQPNIVSFETPIIWYDMSPSRKSHSEYKKYKQKDYIATISKILQPYVNSEKKTNSYINCTGGYNLKSKPCIFTTSDLGPCGVPDYGYEDNKPCIYLKMNKFVGWEPEKYSDKALPYGMSPQLKKEIHASNKKDIIWLDCKGSTTFSLEHANNITFYPHMGFEFKYFPYKAEKDYLSPLVALKINSLDIGYAIAISCKLWAKNIDNTRKENQGLTFIVYVAS